MTKKVKEIITLALGCLGAEERLSVKIRAWRLMALGLLGAITLNIVVLYCSCLSLTINHEEEKSIFKHLSVNSW